MMKKYIYGGYIACSGTFKDSAKAWSNYNILVADYFPGRPPAKAQIIKGASSLSVVLDSIPVGAVVELSFDYYQRITGINVVHSTD